MPDRAGPGWLYSGEGFALNDAPVLGPCSYPEWPFRWVVVDADAWDDQPLDRLWFLPDRASVLPIPPFVLRELAMALGRGFAVGLLAKAEPPMMAAAEALDAWCGGGRA